MIDKYISNREDSLFYTSPENASFDDEFCMSDLVTCIESLKKRSAPGPDGIKNIQLINLPKEGRSLLLIITNASWNYNCIIKDWKISVVTMIDKKSQKLPPYQSHKQRN